jgi:hypothetical protein
LSFVCAQENREKGGERRKRAKGREGGGDGEEHKGERESHINGGKERDLKREGHKRRERERKWVTIID